LREADVRKLIYLCFIPFLLGSCGDLLKLGIDAAKTAGSIVDDLALYYRFDGNTDDSSGNNRDGTQPGGTPFGHSESDRFGNTNTSVRFISTHMDTSWGNGFEVTGEFTINFWIKPKSSSGPPPPRATTKMHLFGIGRVTEPVQIPGVFLEIEKPATTHDLVFSICDQEDFCNKDTVRFNDLWATIDLADWYMVTIVHKDGLGADKISLYIDNVEQSPDVSFSGLSYRVYLKNDLYIGASHIPDGVNPNPSYQMDFMFLDDFRFYTRALNARERAALYYERDYIP
jgi:hypothetical protein